LEQLFLLYSESLLEELSALPSFAIDGEIREVTHLQSAKLRLVDRLSYKWGFSELKIDGFRALARIRAGLPRSCWWLQ